MVMIPRPHFGGIMSSPTTTVDSAAPISFLLGYVKFSEKIILKNLLTEMYTSKLLAVQKSAQ